MQSNIYKYLLLLAILGLAVIAYWNALDNEFVNFDDTGLVTNNRYVKSLSLENIRDIFTPGVAGAYQPVRTLSYAVDYHFWKLNPFGYHLTNVVCHVISIALLYLIVLLLTRQSLFAVIVALLFAIHPVNVEAVTWVSGRRDVLSLVFALCSFLGILRCFPPHAHPTFSALPPDSRTPSRQAFARWYIGALFAYTLALFSKPSVVVVPVLFVLYDVCFLPKLHRNWKRIVSYLPFFLISAGLTYLFMNVARNVGVAKSAYHGGTPLMTSLTMFKVFGDYLRMLVAPRNLSATYGVELIRSFHDVSVWVSYGVLLLTIGLIFISWKRARLVFFGLCWFFIALIPVSNIIPISTVKADRYLYLPAIGCFLAIGWGIAQCADVLKRVDATASFKHAIIGLYWIGIGVIIVTYTADTMKRNQDWQSSESLWSATLETNPDSPIALNNLGIIYANTGRYDQALALFQTVIEKHPFQEEMERVFCNMAEVYVNQNLADKAIDYYQKALELNPEYQAAYLGMGDAVAALGEYERAEQIYQQAISLDTRSESAYTHLGNLYVMEGRSEAAASAFQNALDVNPFHIPAYNGLGMIHAMQGDITAALAMYRKALDIDPASTVIWNSLGNMYMNRGEPENAIASFLKVLEREPNNIEVQNNVGTLYLQIARFPEAIHAFSQSLQQQPNNSKILSNLGLAYTYIREYEKAIPLFRRAVKLEPALSRSAEILGDLCFRTGDIACAADAYEQALSNEPDNAKLLEKWNAARQL